METASLREEVQRRISQRAYMEILQVHIFDGVVVYSAGQEERGMN